MCSHFARCERYISLLSTVGVAFWVQTWQNIQQPCIFLCWFLMHVLRITCPCGWRGCVVVFLSVFSVLFNSPSVFLSLSHPILVIAVWIFVFGLSGVGLIVHLCAALAVSSICHIYCTSMQFSDGVEKKTSLYLELTSPHTTVPEMKSGKIMFKSCRRCFTVDAGYATPQSLKCWFFPKQLLLKGTLK